jgi:hypothetical protein
MKSTRNTAVKAVIGSAIAALTLMGAGSAVAEAPEKSDVTISENNFNFKGKVTSESHACEARRVVSVYRIHDGNTIEVGTDKTDTGGSYKFDVNVVNGGDKHFAVAHKKETDKVTCGESKSEKIFP